MIDDQDELRARVPARRPRGDRDRRSGGIGERLCEALAGVGARSSSTAATPARERGAERLRRRRRRGARGRRRHDHQARRRPRGRRGASALRPRRRDREHGRRRRGHGAVLRPRTTRRRVGPDVGPQPALGAAADPGRGAGDDRGRRGGRVLHFSSVRGQLGIDNGFSAYVAAKGALDALTRQQATEWAKHGDHGQRDLADVRQTPQVEDLLADEEFRAGLRSASRWAGSPRPTTWSARRCCSARRVGVHHRPGAHARRGADRVPVTDVPFTRFNLREQIKDVILQRIVDGEYEPGSRLVETRIAQELGVQPGAGARGAARPRAARAASSTRRFAAPRARALGRRPARGVPGALGARDAGGAAGRRAHQRGSSSCDGALDTMQRRGLTSDDRGQKRGRRGVPRDDRRARRGNATLARQW